MSLSLQFSQPLSTLLTSSRAPGSDAQQVLDASQGYREALLSAHLPTQPLDSVLEILKPACEEGTPTRIAAQAVISRLKRHALFPSEEESSTGFFERLKGLSRSSLSFRQGLNLAGCLGRLFLTVQDLRKLMLRFHGEIPSYARPSEISVTDGSRVFRAEDPLADQPVALKVFEVKGSLTRIPAWVALNELRFQSDPRSEDIVEALETGCIDNGPAFISYRWMAGGALVFRADDWTPDWTLEQTLEIARQMIDQVANLHRRKIIHRDIKPNNYLLDEKCQRVRLTDFTFAIYQEEAAPARDVVGTKGYIAPETDEDDYTDQPSRDVYSLGKTLQKYFDWTFPPRLKTIQGPLSPSEKDFMIRLRRITGRAIDPDTRRRYLDASQMEWEFGRLIG